MRLTYPFWRSGERPWDISIEDFANGYQKIWLELQALAWNRPELQERLAQVHGQWRAVLTEAFTRALADYHVDTARFPVEAVVALVVTFNEGIFLERLGGITEGQAAMIAMIDRWIARPRRQADRPKGGIRAMRARYPDTEGYIERDGVRIFYEVFGEGEPTILLLPSWSIIHSRFWKAQVPYLARHFRVITFDGRGNGRSDRPLDPTAYATEEYVADALAVLDATATQRAVLVSLSMGAQWALLLAAEHADRVAGVAFIGASLPIPPRHDIRVIHSFDDVLDTDEGWAKYNRHYWLKDYRGFLEFFFAQCYNEPHSTKQIEDCVEWGLETTPELLARDRRRSRAAGDQSVEGRRAACARAGGASALSCPRDPRRP